MAEKMNVAVVGATGSSGFAWTSQMLIQMLENHPWFRLGALVSERSNQAGKPFGDALAAWYPPEPLSREVAAMKMLGPDPEALRQAADVQVVISCLPPAMCKEVDPAFAMAGYPVVSESPGLRDWEDVPLLMPEFNSQQLGVIPDQQRNRGWKGFLVSNPVCTIVIITLAMAPLVQRFGVKDAIITTLQALSGAGPHGISSLQIADNLIPYVKLEEEKLRDEGAKIFGRYEGGQVVSHPMRISSTCTRVGVSDGHVAAISLVCERPAPVQEVKDVLASYRGEAQELGLPSAPRVPIYVTEAEDRPQPRLDRYVEGGMSVVVGRVREEPVLENGVKFVAAGHNKARGTAGNTLLCAELLYAKGLLGR